MKKYLCFYLFCLLIVACNNNDSPRPVAEKFIAAFQKHDFEEAAKYSTKETAKMLKQLQRIEELEKVKPVVSEAKIEILSEEIAGNKATVFFREAGSDAEEKIDLKKVIVDPGSKEKEWRVALSKTDVKLPKPFNRPALPDSIPNQVF